MIDPATMARQRGFMRAIAYAHGSARMIDHTVTSKEMRIVFHTMAG